MRSLIFGNLGFVGVHLEDHLKELEHDVFGFDLKRGDDIRNYEQVRTAIELYQPDNIFHLAAMSYVGESQFNPQRAVDVQVKGSLNILEAVRNLGIRPKIHLASTSEEYGYENQTEEVTEESPIRPQTMYGATKSAMTNIAQVYRQTYGLHIVVTRAFNHIGVGQSAQPVSAAFARQIAQIERGELDILRHGNLDTVRNYTDVKDIVRAYAQVINAEPGIYNVCSDENMTTEALLELFIQASTKRITTQVDENIYRTGTPAWRNPSNQKIRYACEWQPSIPLSQSVKAVLNDWRERLI